MKREAWAREILDDDPRACAREAGLRYVEAEEPGITRRRHGKGFTYVDARGKTVRGEADRARFAKLVIPPAWEDVWICADAAGHLQATGRDAEGRKQYLYHAEWRRVRDLHKYDRVVAFGYVLPRIRARVARDLAGEGLSRDRVLASVVRLLETTHVRVGSDEYARDNASYGLTTIRKKHVARAPGEEEVVLEFPGKSAKAWRVEVEDPEVVDVIERCLETPGHELFKYFDDEGAKRDVKSEDVNAYLREAAGAHVTAKDFRTWSGTMLVACALEELERLEPGATADAHRVAAVKRAAAMLGNTPAICRSSYVHPRVLDAEDDPSAVARAVRRCARGGARAASTGLGPEERAILRMLAAGRR